MYIQMCVFMHIAMHICTYVCMHVHTYIRIYLCMYVCVYVCMHACTYVCMYACMYVCMYVIILCVHARMSCLYILRMFSWLRLPKVNWGGYLTLSWVSSGSLQCFNASPHQPSSHATPSCTSCLQCFILYSVSPCRHS